MTPRRIARIATILWRIGGDMARMLARQIATPLSWRFRRNP